MNEDVAAKKKRHPLEEGDPALFNRPERTVDFHAPSDAVRNGFSATSYKLIILSATCWLVTTSSMLVTCPTAF